jgi:hypothetical protein
MPHSVYVLKDLFKTMNSQAVEFMNKNSDKTRSSPSDFSQVMKVECIFLDLHLIPILKRKLKAHLNADVAIVPHIEVHPILVVLFSLMAFFCVTYVQFSEQTCKKKSEFNLMA